MRSQWGRYNLPRLLLLVFIIFIIIIIINYHYYSIVLLNYLFKKNKSIFINRGMMRTTAPRVFSANMPCTAIFKSHPHVPCLVGGWPTPPEKMMEWVTVGVGIWWSWHSQVNGKIYGNMLQSTNQMCWNMLKHVETMTCQDLHTRYTPTSSRKSQAGYRPLFSINGMVPSSGLGCPANDERMKITSSNKTVA